MTSLKGTPVQGLAGATIGFFVGFAAVALFGPVAHTLEPGLGLSPIRLGFAVAAPLLSGSLLRIPFSAWVDTTGGRKPFMVLLSLSIIGMAGLLIFFKYAASGALGAAYFPLLLALGVLCGCGIATFPSVSARFHTGFRKTRRAGRSGSMPDLAIWRPGYFRSCCRSQSACGESQAPTKYGCSF